MSITASDLATGVVMIMANARVNGSFPFSGLLGLCVVGKSKTPVGGSTGVLSIDYVST
jgi:hypothetical protein